MTAGSKPGGAFAIFLRGSTARILVQVKSVLARGQPVEFGLKLQPFGRLCQRDSSGCLANTRGVNEVNRDCYGIEPALTAAPDVVQASKAPAANTRNFLIIDPTFSFVEG